jgi:serine/threonine protein kinase/beta-lactam-binding protein with PASTA domain
MTRLLGGRYELGDVIGRGGMADVHSGYDTRLSRPVAIKLLRPDLARDGNFLVRFRREAQAAAQLNHPSIVAIFDSGDDEGVDAHGNPTRVPYIVMEMVRGRTLRERLNELGHLPPRDAARITEGVLAALAYSHSMGIVHRDIKPGNVMLSPAGEVKVMDFGIARAIADTAATMTQTSAVIGTAQYLSPEQAQGMPVDARSDLYSTGCMLFELLTGRTPFVADTAVALAYQHVGQAPVAPSSVQPDIPPAYDAITLHAMVKDRERRYQDATEFRTDLARARSGEPISAQAMGGTATSTDTAGAIDPVTGGRAHADDRTAYPSGTPAAPTEAIPAARTEVLSTHRDPPTRSDATRTAGRRRRTAYVLLGIVTAVALVLATVLAQGLFRDTGPTLVDVPPLAGQTQEQARTILAAKNLVMVSEPVRNADIAVGLIVDTRPPRGTQVAVGSTVTVEVSSGPGEKVVPNVVGQPLESAKQVMTTTGFTVTGWVEIDDPSQVKGAVVSTDPAVGTIAPLSQSITLRIASGKVKVPRLVDLLTDTARTTVTGLKLVYDDTARVEDDTRLEGTVVAQDIAPDTLVDVGSTIKVTVSRRPTATVTFTPSTPETTSTPGTTSPSSRQTLRP